MERAPPRPHLQLVYSCAAFPLAGSTHEQRVRALSWAIRQIPLPEDLDQEQLENRRAIYDLSIINDEYQARAATA